VACILLCFDFDGTLINSKGLIHPFDINILKNEKRLIFIPTTGRPLHSVKRIFFKNNLFRNQLISFPLILQNGAVLYFSNEKLHDYYPITSKIVDKIIELSTSLHQLTILLFLVDEVLTINMTPHANDFVSRFNLNIKAFHETSETHEVTKIMLISKKEKILRDLNDEFNNLNVESSFSMPTILEINRRGVNKGNMLKILMRDLNIEKCMIIAAGDGDNDLPLFNLATKTFCPKKSSIKIKEKADFIIDVEKEGLFKPMMDNLDLN